MGAFQNHIETLQDTSQMSPSHFPNYPQTPPTKTHANFLEQPARVIQQEPAKKKPTKILPQTPKRKAGPRGSVAKMLPAPEPAPEELDAMGELLKDLMADRDAVDDLLGPEASSSSTADDLGF
jgi:hypothetical protein